MLRNSLAAGRNIDEKKPRKQFRGFIIIKLINYALVTAPDLKQEVHTYIFLGPAVVITLTDLTLDFHILFDFLLEWLTLSPKCAPLSQTAHFAMIAPP